MIKMFLVDYLFFSPFSMIWLMLVIYSSCCLYTWLWDVESSPLHAKVLVSIGQSGFGYVWACLSRGERAAECRESKPSEERCVFWLWWVSARVRPNGHFFYFVQWLMFRGCREVMPNGHSFSVQCTRPWLLGQSSAEWTFFVLNVDAELVFFIVFLWCC